MNNPILTTVGTNLSMGEQEGSAVIILQGIWTSHIVIVVVRLKHSSKVKYLKFCVT